MLNAELPKQQRDKIMNNNTKKVRIGTPLVDTLSNMPIENARETITSEAIKTNHVKVTPKGLGLDIIKVLLLIESAKTMGLQMMSSQVMLLIKVILTFRWK